MQDYLLTNGLYRRPQAVLGSAPQEVLDVVWRVQADFLHAAFEAVQRDHGGLERYLAQQLKVDGAARARLAQWKQVDASELAQLYLRPPGG